MTDKTVLVEAEKQIILEELYEDSLTGFNGLATAYAVYAHGPTMVRLENDNGDKWIEITRVVEVTR